MERFIVQGFRVQGFGAQGFRIASACFRKMSSLWGVSRLTSRVLLSVYICIICTYIYTQNIGKWANT